MAQTMYCVTLLKSLHTIWLNLSPPFSTNHSNLVLCHYSGNNLILVKVTNSTSAHLHVDCLHTVTNRYSLVWIGPQKSMATSFQGSLGMGVMHNGSLSCDMLTTWHRWQCWMWASTILSSPGNHTLVRRYSLVLVIPWWPLCTSLTTLSHSVLGTTIHGPRTTSPPTTANSLKMVSYCGLSALFPCAVKYPLAMASFKSDSSVSECVSSSSSCQVTASGCFTIAMISFSNSSTVSLSSNSVWLLQVWLFCIASGSNGSLLHCSPIPLSFQVHN